MAAERISRLDLDEEAVQNNLGYFAALGAVEDDRKRASGLGVQSPELTDADGDLDAGRRIAAIALEGEGLELGLSPSGRWFVDLGNHGSAAETSAAFTGRVVGMYAVRGAVAFERFRYEGRDPEAAVPALESSMSGGTA